MSEIVEERKEAQPQSEQRFILGKSQADPADNQAENIITKMNKSDYKNRKDSIPVDDAIKAIDVNFVSPSLVQTVPSIVNAEDLAWLKPLGKEGLELQLYLTKET